MKKLLAALSMVLVMALPASAAVVRPVDRSDTVSQSVGNCENGRPKARMWDGINYTGKLLTVCHTSVNTLWQQPWNDGTCTWTDFATYCSADQISSIIFYGPGTDFCQGSQSATLKVYSGDYYSGSSRSFYAPKNESRLWEVMPYGWHNNIESLYIACGVH